MTRTLFLYAIKWLFSDSHDSAVIRGLLLCGAAAILALSAVGILFSPKYLFFLGFLPAALVIAGVLLFGRYFRRWISTQRVVVILASLVILTYVLGGLLNAYVGARVYDGSQYDGAFQLFFPLKRMAAGEWPGRDFFYFHGQLIPVIVYPLFAFLGGDFFAAQLSSKLLDLVIPFFYLLIFYGLGLSRGKLLMAWLILVGLLVTDRFTFGTQNPIDGVHVYTLRSIVPFLYMALMAVQWADKGYREGFLQHFYRRTVFIQALVFVAAFYLGSEQAFFLLATCLLANAIALGRRVWSVLWATCALVLLCVGLLLLSNRLLFGSQQPLTYLADISRNQTWFYGSYPNEFLHAALDFSRPNSSTFKVSAKLLVSLIGLPVLCWGVWRLSARTDQRLFFFTLFGGTYGLLGLTSLLASYSGEQYTDSAIKVILIVSITLLLKAAFGEIAIEKKSRIHELGQDLLAATPWVLMVCVLGSVYSIWVVLNIKNNVRVYRVLDSAMFMDQPDLGVKIPFYPLDEKPDQRYHASQFLALKHAQGHSAARVIYPEFTFVDGFEEGVKNLYRVKLNEAIPEVLAVGDLCAFDGQQFMIADMDRGKNYLYFNTSTLPAGKSQYVNSVECSRPQGQGYIQYDKRRVLLEQNTYDSNFYDGIFRGKSLQLRVTKPERKRLRVGDGLVLSGHEHKIMAIHANGVVVLDTTEHPLPFDFDQGAAYSVVQRIQPDGGFSYTLDISAGELAITRIALNDKALLAELLASREVWLLNNGQSAHVVSVDLTQGTATLRGNLKLRQLLYGLHLGQLNKSDYSTVGAIPVVFQLMKGILSAKTVNAVAPASSIDFFFHAFDSALFSEYLNGLKTQAPLLISTPSGRYVSNFIWYDNWLVRARWPVFEYVLSGYDPVAHSKFETFWSKGEDYPLSADWVQLERTVGADSQQWAVPAVTPDDNQTDCETSAYVVELDYTISGWQRSLPLLGASTRHMMLIDDYLGVPLTFNPNEHRVRFPVFPRGKEARLQLKTLASFGIDTSLSISAARYHRLNVPASRLAAVIGRSASSVCQ